MVTSNLNLNTSIVGTDSDINGATREQANIELLDLHDHTTGKGVKIPTGGLNINADLPMASNSLTGLKSNQFSSQSSALATTNTLYVKNGELFYIDNAGNSVQITSGGSVSVATLLSGNVFLDGGNTRGANLRLGSNDNYSFFFETNNTDRFQINGSGFMSFISDWGFQPSTNSSTGSINDVSTSTTSYLQMTGVGSTTITGLANGSSGKTLLISNQTGSGLTIKNESASSTAANRIQTGTGNDISIADKASAILIYNATTSRWSLLTGAATAPTLTYPVGNIAANDSNVTFTSADNRVQICTPTAARTYTLPSTSISAGDRFQFFNQSTTAANIITVQSSGANTIDYVLPNGELTLVALQASPTTAAHWKVISASSAGFLYTPSSYAGLGTPTNVTIMVSRNRNYMSITGTLTTGTVSASVIDVALYNGFSINSSLIRSGTTISGTWGRAAAVSVFSTLLDSSSLTNFRVGGNGAGAPTSVQGGTALGSTEIQSFTVVNIPISGWN